MNLNGISELLYYNYVVQINELYKQHRFDNIVINPYKLRNYLGEIIDDVVWQYIDDKNMTIKSCIIKNIDKNNKNMVTVIFIDDNTIANVYIDELYLSHQNYKKYKCCFERKKI